MKIQELFAKDINRTIKGVVQVGQDTDSIIKQEVEEYVITKELKKHFLDFFSYYSAAFDRPTSDIGVWISGFFGSGKSHFLKMLSYILENKTIDGKSTVEHFREKFADDPMSFMNIDKSTRSKTETILFDIGVEGSIHKDKTAVLRVFAKMFFKHLGFHGDDLDVALMEYYIESQDKTDEFRRNIEAIKGKPWVEIRKAFRFNRTPVVQALVQTLGISEDDAKAWFDNKTKAEYSVARFVEDVKAYVSKQPANYRLLFMVDEVGQYVGADVDLLLDLQSIVSELGSKCEGKVWVACTGQESVDDIIKVRTNEFSRILDRFKTRLALSSSAADEVIQKRLLQKTPEAVKLLEKIYDANDSVLRNLFTFSQNNTRADIKGFVSAMEYVQDYPFIPYQFTLIQKVYTEIRRHGNAGFNMSDGARSMLSGFQESARKIKDSNEYALVPFHCFYDTVHSSLDSTIRRVIERCVKAAENRDGIEPYDVSVLKTLYLIRYIPDDIKGNLDNIVILMADSITVDKISLREKVQASLDRLLRENYIGKSGDTYNFLTDEEQDIQRDISTTMVDSSAIVQKIFNIIFGDIYPSSKYTYGKTPYPFDRAVDGNESSTGCGMKLKFLTSAIDATEKSELRLRSESMKQVICVLSDEFKYFENLEKVMRVRKYVQQRSTSQMAKSIQDIIRGHQDEASNLEKEATALIAKAIENGEFYVAGEKMDIKGGDAKSKIEQALEYLVTNVYDKLDLINHHVETDAEIIEVLRGDKQMFEGLEYNREAAAEVEQYLEMQMIGRRPTSMADIQSRYRAVPYGWTEAEIAYVVAMLIHNQKATIKYGGETIQPNNPKLIDMLRKKSEIGKTSISKREEIPLAKANEVRKFLREYFDEMNVPADDDGLVRYITEKFDIRRQHYSELQRCYSSHKYPDYDLVYKAMQLIDDVLSQRKDNIALVNGVLRRKVDLLDNKEDMEAVESFFNNQRELFDKALKLLADLREDTDYLSQETEITDALQKIRSITSVGSGKYNYNRIPELNGLIATVTEGHSRLLAKKREEVLEYVRQCLAAVHQANKDGKQMASVQKADNYYDQKKAYIASCMSLALLDGLTMQLFNYKDETVRTVMAMQSEKPAHAESVHTKAYKTVNRSIAFPTRILETEAEIDEYVEEVRANLKNLLGGSDGINIK